MLRAKLLKKNSSVFFHGGKKPAPVFQIKQKKEHLTLFLRSESLILF